MRKLWISLLFLLMMDFHLQALIYYQPNYNQSTQYDQARGYPSDSLILPNQALDDKAISRKIELEIRIDPSLGPYADMIQVQTLHGDVVLTGRLDSDRIRLGMERKAKGVRGVRQVYNNIELYTTR